MLCRTRLGLGFLVVTATGASAAEGMPNIGWTLSSSPTDPFVNAGAATTDTLDLYLWLFCSNDSSGVDRAQFGITPCGGTLEVIDFVPRAGVVENPVSFPCDVDLSLPGCPRGSFLAGHFPVIDPLGVFEICFAPTDLGTGVEESYACASPMVGEENAWIGYTTYTKPVPCSAWTLFFGNCFPPTLVEETSWGRVKALYSD
jgi:hypothetical protein